MKPPIWKIATKLCMDLHHYNDAKCLFDRAAIVRNFCIMEYLRVCVVVRTLRSTPHYALRMASQKGFF